MLQELGVPKWRGSLAGTLAQVDGHRQPPAPETAGGEGNRHKLYSAVNVSH